MLILALIFNCIKNYTMKCAAGCPDEHRAFPQVLHTNADNLTTLVLQQLYDCRPVTPGLGGSVQIAMIDQGKSDISCKSLYN